MKSVKPYTIQSDFFTENIEFIVRLDPDVKKLAPEESVRASGEL